MRFLLEADNNSLLSIKNQLEQKENIRYSSLNDSKRLNFIARCVDRAKNNRTLKKARGSTIQAIRDSNWNQNVLSYLDRLDGQNVTNAEVSLITDLLSDNKVSANADWLYNNSLYDRDVSDALYTIKALTLASNPELQNKKDAEGNLTNKYFKEGNALTVNDLKDGSKIREAAEIQDIIAGKEDPEKIKQSASEESNIPQNIRNYLKQLAKNSKVEVDVDKTIDTANSTIKQELAQVLGSLKWGNQAEIQSAINDAFEEGQTTEFLLNKILKGRG